jgi:hypothetical protein
VRVSQSALQQSLFVVHGAAVAPQLMTPPSPRRPPSSAPAPSAASPASSGRFGTTSVPQAVKKVKTVRRALPQAVRSAKSRMAEERAPNRSGAQRAYPLF